MKCDIGLLQAYADGALAPDAEASVGGHLSGCPACRQSLSTLRTRAEFLAARLDSLGPAASGAPAPAQALARFRSNASVRAHPAHIGVRAPATGAPIAGLWLTLERRLMMVKDALTTNRWRGWAMAATAVICVALLFSFAPVRQAAADFLGVFRVRKFAVIPLDQSQQQKIESLAQLAEGGRFGQPTVVREAGKSQPVADLAAASKLAGFAVRSPATLPAGAAATSLTVERGPAVHYEMDRATMQALLDAAQVQGVQLPAVDKVTIDVDVPYVVMQQFTLGAGRLTLTQMASPQVNIPPGVDPAAIGEVGFRFLGMPEADAKRLAQSIDWSSTLVIPLPTNIIQYREVTVDGALALLVEHRPANGSRPAASLLWQKDGVLHSITTTNVDALVVIQMADSLR